MTIGLNCGSLSIFSLNVFDGFKKVQRDSPHEIASRHPTFVIGNMATMFSYSKDIIMNLIFYVVPDILFQAEEVI